MTPQVHVIHSAAYKVLWLIILPIQKHSGIPNTMASMPWAWNPPPKNRYLIPWLPRLNFTYHFRPCYRKNKNKKVKRSSWLDMQAFHPAEATCWVLGGDQASLDEWAQSGSGGQTSQSRTAPATLHQGPQAGRTYLWAPQMATLRAWIRLFWSYPWDLNPLGLQAAHPHRAWVADSEVRWKGEKYPKECPLAWRRDAISTAHVLQLPGSPTPVKHK